MSKILITSLGTGVAKKGQYNSARYKIEDKIYEERFIAKALYNHIKFDRIFMIGTCRSMWDVVYEAFGGKDEDLQFKLYDKQEKGSLEKSDLQVIETAWNENFGIKGSKTFIVDYGLNDNQLWNNFETYLQIADYIENGDEIYLDITHSFRSLSLMSYIMLDFVKSMRQKQFTVEAIYYGMFEYVHEPSNTEKITPIINLKILFEISEWIKAISVFKNYGRAELVAERLNVSYGADEVSKYFARFSEAVSIANLSAIKSYVNRMKNKLSDFERSDSVIMKLVSKDLISFIKRMDKNGMSDFQLEMAKWLCENKNYAMSYIALAESVVSKICEIEGIGLEEKEDRNKAKKILHNQAKYKKLLDAYLTPNRIRNGIAHQLSNRKDSTINDINNLQHSIINIEKNLAILKRYGDTPNFYLFFSHSLTETQIKEIKTIFKCSKIIPLPSNLQELWSNIRPEGNLASILTKFQNYLGTNSKAGDYVLVEGDFGATFAIVDWCIANGRIPVYATTERIAEEERKKNGTVKLVHTFKHVMFRKYSL